MKNVDTVFCIFLLLLIPNILVAPPKLSESNLLEAKSGKMSSEWSKDIRLTYGGRKRCPSIAVNNECVHVVWDNGTSPYEIYYKRGLARGEIWEAEKMISMGESGTVCSYPKIALNGNKIHVVYEDDRDGGRIEIYYVNLTYTKSSKIFQDLENRSPVQKAKICFVK